MASFFSLRKRTNCWRHRTHELNYNHFFFFYLVKSSVWTFQKRYLMYTKFFLIIFPSDKSYIIPKYTFQNNLAFFKYSRCMDTSNWTNHNDVQHSIILNKKDAAFFYHYIVVLLELQISNLHFLNKNFFNGIGKSNKVVSWMFQTVS